jgi:cytochrome P450
MMIKRTDTYDSSLLFYLTRHPKALAKLQQEVNGLFVNEPYDAAKLGNATYINACINEALRLIPPGPNGMQRVVNTPGGIILNGKHVPYGTKISVHGWSVHHDPRNFERPNEFIPERWIEGSGFKGVHNISAFIPFSQGTYQCVGRRLALQESRMFMAK